MIRHKIANFSKEKARKIIKLGEKHKLVKKESIDSLTDYLASAMPENGNIPLNNEQLGLLLEIQKKRVTQITWESFYKKALGVLVFLPAFFTALIGIPAAIMLYIFPPTAILLLLSVPISALVIQITIDTFQKIFNKVWAPSPSQLTETNTLKELQELQEFKNSINETESEDKSISVNPDQKNSYKNGSKQSLTFFPRLPESTLQNPACKINNDDNKTEITCNLSSR